MTYRQKTSAEIVAIEQRAWDLTIKINKALADFKPTGRFAHMERATSEESFSPRGRDPIFTGGRLEAEELAQQMAGPRWEVWVSEMVGGRYVATIRRYIDPEEDEPREFRYDEYC